MWASWLLHYQTLSQGVLVKINKEWPNMQRSLPFYSKRTALLQMKKQSTHLLMRILPSFQAVSLFKRSFLANPVFDLNSYSNQCCRGSKQEFYFVKNYNNKHSRNVFSIFSIPLFAHLVFVWENDREKKWKWCQDTWNTTKSKWLAQMDVIIIPPGLSFILPLLQSLLSRDLITCSQGSLIPMPLLKPDVNVTNSIMRWLMMSSFFPPDTLLLYLSLLANP